MVKLSGSKTFVTYQCPKITLTTVVYATLKNILIENATRHAFSMNKFDSCRRKTYI